MLLVMPYGPKIRAHRKRLGLSQPAFAQRFGIPDAGTISRWELDKAVPSPERLEQLREDGADIPPRTEPRTLGQRVAALEEAVDLLLSERNDVGAATIANDDPSTDSDDHDQADDQATAAEVAGRRHPERGAASTRRSRDSKS